MVYNPDVWQAGEIEIGLEGWTKTYVDGDTERLVETPDDLGKHVEQTYGLGDLDRNMEAFTNELTEHDVVVMPDGLRDWLLDMGYPLP